jgi:hypothetical protein
MISLLCISLFDLKIPSHLSVTTPLECAPNFISTHQSEILFQNNPTVQNLFSDVALKKFCLTLHGAQSLLLGSLTRYVEAL